MAGVGRGECGQGGENGGREGGVWHCVWGGGGEMEACGRDIGSGKLVAGGAGGGGVFDAFTGPR